jgi:hypothetical protein
MTSHFGKKQSGSELSVEEGNRSAKGQRTLGLALNRGVRFGWSGWGCAIGTTVGARSAVRCGHCHDGQCTRAVGADGNER